MSSTSEQRYLWLMDPEDDRPAGYDPVLSHAYDLAERIVSGIALT